MKTLLIIEDDAYLRQFLVQALEDDYDTLESGDGMAGVLAAVDHDPSLILLDLTMPRMSGWEVVELLKGDERTSHIPIFVLTGHTDDGLRDRLREAGAAAFFEKPVDPDVLKARVDEELSD